MDDGETLRRSEALASGLADHELRSLYTRGGWQKLGHGLYVQNSALDVMSKESKHRLAVAAAIPAVSSEVAVSHQSAAILHGLPLWNVPLNRVHVTRDRSGGGRTKSGVVLHCSPLGRVAECDGTRVTTPARTVVDLARTVAFESAVVVGDAAVRKFRLSDTDLLAELKRARGWKGIAAAKRVVEFLDGKSESVGESRSRVMLAEAGLQPETQVEIYSDAGVLIGRTDFFFEPGWVLGEFDGKAKYTKYLRPGQDTSDAVYEEKLREDLFRDLGYPVVRWGWSDLNDPGVIVERIRRAIARGSRPPPPRGNVRRTG